MFDNQQAIMSAFQLEIRLTALENIFQHITRPDFVKKVDYDVGRFVVIEVVE